MTRQNFREFVLGALPGTKSHIEERSGVSRSAVLAWIAKLHAAGEIHISRWLPHPRGGRAMAVYALGSRPDAVCKLKTLTKRQIRLRYEAKAKADGRYDVVRARMRNRYWTKKAATQGDPLVAAMFGAPAAREVRS